MMIIDSIYDAAGIHTPPPEYQQKVHEKVRRAGGLILCDEVQSGLTRMGDNFWGFMDSGVVPDIVTMGKPIGNGHPLGAVVTTPKIADAFANGMEYFNTYGGNPVSCEIGSAVLDVIEEDGLPAKAASVGEQLRLGLAQLKSKHEVIGDARGLGMFLGIELVRDRRTQEPAADIAGYIVERAKQQGTLLSTDGPLHNVIKIKPPLAFSEADARRLVDALDGILEEGFVLSRL